VVAMRGAQSEDFVKSIEHFERAVAIDPDFALAHASIARSQYQFAFTGPAAPLVFMPKAEKAVRKALQIDPRLSEAHAILGNILHRFHWDWAAAESHFLRALELTPSDAATHRLYSRFLSARGRLDESAAHRTIARKLDPKIAELYLDEPQGSREEFERAVAEYRPIVQRTPSTRGHFRLGSALVMDGQFEEGLKWLEASQPYRHGRSLGYLGYAYGASGNQVKAREILADLHQRSRKRYISSFAIALVHVGLRENDLALERLQQAYREHAFELSTLKMTPAFDVLKSDPRYTDLVRKLGL